MKPSGAGDSGAEAQRDEIEEFRQSYEALFGSVGELPQARFELSGRVAPDFLAMAERLRAQALYSDVFDVKLTQLFAFAALLSVGHPAAEHHARAALRAGAKEVELHKVVEIVTVAGAAFRPFNQGAAILHRLASENR